MASHDDARTGADVYPEKEPGTAHGTIHDKDSGSGCLNPIHDPGPANGDSVDTNFQPGVQNMEAVTVAWSTTWLVIAYVLIWLIYFIQGLVTGVSGSLLPHVTSAFAEYSLTPTTGILSTVIGGITNLSIAKVLDIFSYPQGFLLYIVLVVIGLIILATYNNVEAYATS